MICRELAARPYARRGVIVLTMYHERERLVPLLADGARGYLTKDAAAGRTDYVRFALNVHLLRPGRQAISGPHDR